MLTILVLGAIAAGLARVAGAPKALQQGIVLGIVLLVFGRAVVDPSVRPSQDQLWGWVRGVIYLGLAAIPILAYAALIRRLRRQAAGPEPEEPAHPTGFVLIQDDAALLQDTLPQEITPPEESFSIAHRDGEGVVTAVGRVTIIQGLARFGPVWCGSVTADALFSEMEAEARRRGAAKALLERDPWAEDLPLAELGYATAFKMAYPDGGDRIIWEKPLGVQ